MIFGQREQAAARPAGQNNTFHLLSPEAAAESHFAAVFVSLMIQCRSYETSLLEQMPVERLTPTADRARSSTRIRSRWQGSRLPKVLSFRVMLM